MRLAPSILSADLYNLGGDLERAFRAGAHMAHVDVMDGHFVPNITMGIPLLRSLRKHVDREIDVHLMIDNPDIFAPRFADAGADYVSVHVEGTHHLDRVLASIRERKKRCGVVLNPHTPIESIEWVLPRVDLVLLMSVNPGFGGQVFLDYTLDKIRDLRHLVDERGLSLEIEVDGGITPENAGEVVRAGADILVAGSAVFSANDRDIENNVKAMLRSMDRKGF